MLKCGECEYRHLGTRHTQWPGYWPSYCDHPWMHSSNGFYEVSPDDKCLHEFPNVWAAKGAARLQELVDGKAELP